jgi:hypothetical protein
MYGKISTMLVCFTRLILLRKRPQLIKLICAIVVFLALLLSLVPVIAGMEDGSGGKDDYLQQKTIARVLWPLCFMFGFVRTGNF